MTQYRETIAEYNVLYKNTFETVVNDVFKLMGLASVIALNEGAAHVKGRPHNQTPAAAIRAVCKRKGWRYFFSGESDWLIWDPKVWRRTTAGAFAVKVSPSAKELGHDFPFSPARRMVSVKLDHIASKTRHRFYVTHLVQGYASAEGRFSDAFEDYKDRAARAGVHRIDEIVRRRQVKETRVKFDHLLGDMNSRQSNRQEPFYPARVWTGPHGVWVPDTLPKSIDWMLHSKRSEKNGLEVKGRRTLGHEDGLHSDHRAGLKRVAWTTHARKS